MRHEGVVDTVATFEEESKTGNQTEHGGLVVRVEDTDGDEEGTGNDGVGVQEDLLAPDGAGGAVSVISGETTEGAADDVEETEHGSPVTSDGGSHVLRLEVEAVVCTEDGVDRELSTEGAEVAGTLHESLGGEDDLADLLGRGLADDLDLGGFEHVCWAHLGFVVAELRVDGWEDILLVSGLELRLGGETVG